MSVQEVPTYFRRGLQLLALAILFLLFASTGKAQQGAILPNSGFVVFGHVKLPDNKPAVRVRVYLEMPNGAKRDILTDDQGYYEIRGLPTGRYHLSAVNPNDPTMYSDPADSDSTRGYANRLQINIYLRLPLHKDKQAVNTSVIHINDAKIPKAARKAFEQGLKLQKENQSGKALTHFTQAIDLYPEYFQALTERANLLMQQNKLAEAETDFVRALQHNAKYTLALRGLGYCQIQQKKFGDALGNLEKAYSLEPNAPMSLLLLGYANLSLSRHEEAKQCLQEALRLDKKGAARAHVYLAEIFARENKFKEAADEVREYLKVKPDATDAAHLKELEAQWRGKAAKK